MAEQKKTCIMAEQKKTALVLRVPQAPQDGPSAPPPAQTEAELRASVKARQAQLRAADNAQTLAVARAKLAQYRRDGRVLGGMGKAERERVARLLREVEGEVSQIAGRVLELYEIVQAVRKGYRPERCCGVCHQPIPPTRRPQSLYCSQKCQNSAWYYRHKRTNKYGNDEGVK